MVVHDQDSPSRLLQVPVDQLRPLCLHQLKLPSRQVSR
jgi:hypothetical protein